MSTKKQNKNNPVVEKTIETSPVDIPAEFQIKARDKKKSVVEYHEIRYRDTKGGIIITGSTWGKPGEIINLENCPEEHPAWNKDSKNNINQRVDQVVRFQEKHGNLANELAQLLHPKTEKTEQKDQKN